MYTYKTEQFKENENRNQMDLKVKTSNNERLESAGDNDRRSKRFCSNAVLCVSFRGNRWSKHAWSDYEG